LVYNSPADQQKNMSKAETASRIVKLGVIPIIRTPTTGEARQIIDAVLAAGATIIEVTMGVPDGIELIAELSSKYEDVLFGAGTVRDAKTAAACVAAGAKFIVSPSTNVETIKYCNENDIVVVPGALTPNEIEAAWDLGADFVKIFPSTAVGGPRYLRLLKGPLPHIKLIPTGGVTVDLVAEFLRAGAEAVGTGPDLLDLEALRQGRADIITETARKYLEAVREARA
jgi:2-dehydro-3-deoxyphosphogluconate aldolase/(4S)-4-hydroxy-2-oxoglutarate aldolase